MKGALGLTCLAGLAAALAFAEEPASPAPAESPGIQDNSFLIEESYNQDPGVVQHISEFTRSFDSGDWVYAFTQEWPVPAVKHQLSYTVPIQRLGGGGATAGLGDALLNYRYQLKGDGDARVAIAPRASLIVPTGSTTRSYGSGVLGFQTNVPLSLVLGPRFVAHWNAGATLLPSAKGPTGDRATTLSYNLGQSVIWLATSRFNVMLEAFYTSVETIVGPGRTERADVLLLSPGIRWAYNFESGLQIVPGVAAPIGVGPSRGQTSLLLYLSFEHPFRTTGR